MHLVIKRALSVAAASAVVAGALALGTPAGAKGTASAGLAARVAASTNPLAGGPWGVYTGDEVGTAWAAATGSTKAALAKIALQPRVRWFTSSLAISDAYDRVSDYIAEAQHGNKDALVQMALFRLWPHGETNRNHRLTKAEQGQYKNWVNEVAKAIGDNRVAVVLEPDLALTAPPMQSGAMRTADPKVRQDLVRWASWRLSQLPRTSVYLDAGDADWLSVDKAVTLLANTGVQYARGFALGATHYSATPDNVAFVAELAAGLSKRGIRGKHAVLDTADNGRPFTWMYWHDHQRYLGKDFDNAAVCKSRTATHCDTLGRMPTWQVTRWSLGSQALNRTATAYVDAYLWFGRPWLTRQASPYNQSRAVAAGKSTPYSQANITGGAAYVD